MGATGQQWNQLGYHAKGLTMQALIRSRQSAYAYGHRVTLWATLCPDYAVEDYEIYAEIPGNSPAWYGGVENAWLPARNTLLLTSVRPYV